MSQILCHTTNLDTEDRHLTINSIQKTIMKHHSRKTLFQGTLKENPLIKCQAFWINLGKCMKSSSELELKLSRSNKNFRLDKMGLTACA